jgi:SspJ family small acid-soluble spore protein
VTWSGVRRTTARIADDRAVVVAALEEAGRALRFDELLEAASGKRSASSRLERDLQTDLAALRRAGRIVEAWDVWTWTYRLATAEDLDDEEDRRDVERLRAAWILSDHATDRS